MEFTVRLPDFGDVVDRARGATAAAITAAMREASDGLKADLRAQTIGAGLGTRLANTWRGTTYPEGRDSLTPAGFVYSNAPLIIDAFSRGAAIRPVNGARYLWIPTENVPKARRRLDRTGKVARGGRLTPEEVENLYNDDLYLRPGTNGGKLAFINVVGGKNGRGFRRGTKGRTAQGRTAQPVLMFVLRRTVRLPKLIDPQSLAERWITRLPGLISRRLR